MTPAWRVAEAPPLRVLTVLPALRAFNYQVTGERAKGP